MSFNYLLNCHLAIYSQSKTIGTTEHSWETYNHSYYQGSLHKSHAHSHGATHLLPPEQIDGGCPQPIDLDLGLPQ